ncbi:MAG: hypothetical protein ACOY3M_00400 [Patescibacteria group bacterium]
MHLHHFFHPNQLYLTLETLLKTKNRLDNIELPRSSYPNFSSFVDTTVFNRKSNNSLSILWDIASISTVVRRREIIRPLKEADKIECYKDLFSSFSKYLKSKNDIKSENVDQIPLTITLSNTKTQAKHLESIINQYISLFVDDELVGNGRDINFNTHLDIFREYMDKVLRIYNPKYLLISPKDLMGLLKEKYSFVNEEYTDYKFMEMVMTLWIARVIDVYDLEIEYKDNKYNYSVTIALKETNSLSNETIRERFKLSSTRSLFVTPTDRSYTYENSQLIFRLTDGSTDQFDFSRADKSRKMFEAFWDLWKKDNTGRYTIKQICESYKLVNKEEIEVVTKIGETVTNIRSTIIEPKHRIKDNVEWQFDRKKNLWIFRILMKRSN